MNYFVPVILNSVERSKEFYSCLSGQAPNLIRGSEAPPTRRGRRRLGAFIGESVISDYVARLRPAQY